MQPFSLTQLIDINTKVAKHQVEQAVGAVIGRE